VSAEQWVTVTGNAVVLIAAVLSYLSTRRKVEQVHEVAAKTAKLVAATGDKVDKVQDAVNGKP
jgi:hypothetical protein